MDKKNMKLLDISYLKTLMMLLVVLYHCCIFFNGNWFNYVKPVSNERYIIIFAEWLNTFHIYIFTFASGYLFSYLLNIGKYKNIKDVIKKRFCKLIVPLIFTLFLWVIPCYVIFNKFDFTTILKKYILLYSPSQLWFLPMLFNVYILMYVLKDKFKFNTKRELLTVFIVGQFLSLVLNKVNINFFQVSHTFKFMPYFYLGEYFYKNKINIKIEKSINIFIFSIFLFMLYRICSNFNSKLCYIKYVISPVLSALEVMSIYSIIKWVNERYNIENKLYKLFESLSFGIFLFHQQIIQIITVIINGKFNPYIQVIFTYLLTLLISMIITKFLKKFKITKFMFGI